MFDFRTHVVAISEHSFVRHHILNLQRNSFTNSPFLKKTHTQKNVKTNLFGIELNLDLTVTSNLEVKLLLAQHDSVYKKL